MTTEQNYSASRVQRQRVVYRGGASEAVYGLGLLGAWFYYLTHAATIWIGLLGLLKGVFWPAILVYELLKFLNL